VLLISLNPGGVGVDKIRVSLPVDKRETSVQRHEGNFPGLIIS